MVFIVNMLSISSQALQTNLPPNIEASMSCSFSYLLQILHYIEDRFQTEYTKRLFQITELQITDLQTRERTKNCFRVFSVSNCCHHTLWFSLLLFKPNGWQKWLIKFLAKFWTWIFSMICVIGDSGPRKRRKKRKICIKKHEIPVCNDEGKVDVSEDF